MQPADINRICAALGLTQVQLARVLHVEPPTVSHWKAGRAVKSPATRGALAALLGLVEILEEHKMIYADLTDAKRVTKRGRGEPQTVYVGRDGGYIAVFDHPSEGRVPVLPFYDEQHVPEGGSAWYRAVVKAEI